MKTQRVKLFKHMKTQDMDWTAQTVGPKVVVFVIVVQSPSQKALYSKQLKY